MKPTYESPTNAPHSVFFDLDRTILKGDAFVHVTRQAIQEGIFTFKDYLIMGALLVNEILSQLFAPRLFAHGFVLYRNKPKKRIDSVIDHTKQKLIDSLYREAVTLIQEYKSKGAHVYIITGTFERVAEIICTHLQLDGYFGTHLKTYTKNKTEYLTGTTTGYVRGKTKAAVIKNQFSQESIENSIAYSDSIIDMPFLTQSKKQVVINPDIRLWIVSKIKKWPILRFKK